MAGATTTIADFAPLAGDVPPPPAASNGACPAAKVLAEAEATGPKTGWRDGWLTAEQGFLEPTPGASMLALRRTHSGAVWVSLAMQLPALIASLSVEVSLTSRLPVLAADEAAVPAAALIAADVVLSNLAAAFSWEWRRAHPGGSWELGLLPPGVLEPWRTICGRLQLPDVGLTFNALVGGRYRVLDPTVWTEEEPYAARVDNLLIEPPVFGSREERVFLGVIVESLAIFATALPSIIAAQEAVLADDPRAAFDALAKVLTAVNQLTDAFHKISPNASYGRNYVDPVVWGKTVAPLNSPINPAANSPGGSGLYVPLFHALDCFLGRTNYTSGLGIEALHLRKWFPKNWRDLCEALATPSLSIRAYADRVEGRRAAGEALPPLRRMYDQALESYAGERGWLGTHRYKVFGFLQLVFKTGRTSTNGCMMDDAEQPWPQTAKPRRARPRAGPSPRPSRRATPKVKDLRSSRPRTST